MMIYPGLLPSHDREQLDLTGEWSFALDPNGRGEAEEWYRRLQSGRILVPGSWEEQGYGERPPEQIIGWSKKRSYEGAAWYVRQVEIPNSWRGKKIWLQLEGVNWTTGVWLNGTHAGSGDSLSAPHRFDLTDLAHPGEPNLLAIKVNNKVEGILNYEAHIHSRHTATNWGGIVGAVRLVATPRTWIEGLKIFPDARRRTVRCEVSVASTTGARGTVEARAEVEGRRIAGAKMPLEIAQPGVKVLTLTLELGPDARLWSDRDPFLYELHLELTTEEGVDVVDTRFGLRTFEVRGRKLYLNDEPLYLRGYVDCCIFPLTGYPPHDKSVYLQQFRRAKDYGFNHVRLHSWTPPDAFYEAADEVGMLVQNELPNWGNCNDPRYLAGAGDFLRSELERVVLHLQRHPSLVIHCMGNELLQSAPHGASHRYSPFLNQLVRRGRELDPSRLYLDQSGFGHLPEEPDRETDLNSYRSFRGTTPDSTTTWSTRVAGGRLPVIAHEHTQMDMYTRLDSSPKFTGVIEPSWEAQAMDALAAKQLLDEADRYYRASARLQLVCIKEQFERIRRTPELSGLQMLNLTDFPGQGTALNGVLDVFWEPKGHASAEVFRQFNAETVLLCACPRRTFPEGGWMEARLLLSHYGPDRLRGDVRWELAAGQDVLAWGKLAVGDVPPGGLYEVGTLALRMPTGPKKLTLRAHLEGSQVHNSWDFWVFPTGRTQEVGAGVRLSPGLAWLADYYNQMEVIDRCEHHRGVILTDRLNVRYVEEMYNGATVVYLAENDQLQDAIPTGFESLFWTYLWFPNQPRTTMGLVVEDHPLMRRFPHDGHSDWQWYHLVEGAQAVGMEVLPSDLRPIVAVVDNWHRARKLGYMFEGRVGRGRFLMTTLQLLGEYPCHPEAVYLLDQLLGYIQGEEFSPATRLALAHIWSLPRSPIHGGHL